MKYEKQFNIEMKRLGVYVPKVYYDILQEISDDENISKSEAFRLVNGLMTQEFNFDFSTHDKPLLNYAQTISIIQYSMLEFIHSQMVFHTNNKNINKAKFYEYLYKLTKIQYDYYDKSLLTMLDEGFESLTDDLSEKLAERVETIAYALEKGTTDEWNEINKIGKKIIKRERKRRNNV